MFLVFFFRNHASGSRCLFCCIHACGPGRSFSIEFTPWGSAFLFLNLRLWAGVFSFEVTLGGSGVWILEITPRRDAKKDRDPEARKSQLPKGPGNRSKTFWGDETWSNTGKPKSSDGCGSKMGIDLVGSLWATQYHRRLKAGLFKMEGWPILIHNPYRKATTKGTPCVTPGKD